MTRRVVLAPLAFKGNLSAADVAHAMAVGAASTAECDLRPMADGGDGSLDALVRAGFATVPVQTRGPIGDPARAAIAVRGDVAVVELAVACGMGRLPGGRLEPMASSTLGLADAMRAALDGDPRELIVCLGGSASTDGGAGLLAGLGARLLDGHGHEVSPSGRALGDVAALDLSHLDPRLADVDITIAVDVGAPLLGPTGAAAVFAPQKGATPADVLALDANLASWHDVLSRTTGRAVADVPGAGAAGGTGAALLSVLNARVRPGAEVMAEATGLARAIEEADLVITGEGRLDRQTRMGKGAAFVAQLARAAGRPALAVCGRIDLDAERMHDIGFAAWADCRSRVATDEESLARSRALISAATREVLDRMAGTADG